jgi:hypothetical protein
MNDPKTPPTLTLNALRELLAEKPDQVISVIWPDGEPIEAHFHVTEVGRVQKDFVDCGGTVRRVTSCLLQTWVGDDVDHRITTGKLLKALALAAPILGDDDLPVELEYEACNVVQLRVVSLDYTADGAVIQLAKKHTDCLAKELCCVPSTQGAGSNGCC